MLVFRVADPKQTDEYNIPAGPYTRDDHKDWELEMAWEHNGPSHPTPFIDGMQDTFQYNHYCAFKSEEDVYRWFEGWIKNLVNDGYKLFVYFISDSEVLHGDHQVAADIRDTTPIDVRNLEVALDTPPSAV